MNVRRWTRIAALVALAALGCSRPEDRYRVLSFFFDGVPVPGAEEAERQRAAEEAARRAKSDETLPRNGVFVASHAPFAKNQCGECHKPDIAAGMKAPTAVLCAGCHPPARAAAETMHTPFTRGECTSCHDPHRSSHPGILVVAPAELCDGCHGPAKYTNRAAHAAEKGSDCLSCHAPHGGRPGLLRTVARVAPASAPASAPVSVAP